MKYQKTQDILRVKEALGHKSLNNTMLYAQLKSFNDDDFKASVAHTEEEFCKFGETGFSLVSDFGDNKIF
jgi:hypothetical protein